jgi:type II secretory pathway component HofQ
MIYPLAPTPIAAYVLTLPQQKTDPLISLDFKETPIRPALETLFKTGGVKNYILDKSISGTVTLTAKDLPFQEALSLVLTQNSQALTMSYQSVGENEVLVIRPKVHTKPARSYAGGLLRCVTEPQKSFRCYFLPIG